MNIPYNYKRTYSIMNNVSPYDSQYTNYGSQNLRGTSVNSGYHGPRNRFQSKYKSTLRKGRISKKLEKAVKAISDREIFKNAEVKAVSLAPAAVNIGAAGYASFATTNCYQLTPGSNLSITQGVDQSSRIGNSIRPTKAIFHFALHALAYDVTVNPTPESTIVRMWFLRQKNSPSTSPSAGTWQSGFFQRGNTTADMDGTVGDLLQPINTDVYHVYGVKTYKMGFASNGGTGTDVAAQSYNNNDFHEFVEEHLDFLKWCPKTINYQDNTSTPTMSPSVNVVMEVLNADGSAMGSTKRPIRLTWSIEFEFIDI